MKWMLAFVVALTALAGCLEGNDADVDGPAATAELVDALAAWQAGEPAANLELLGAYENGNSAEIDAWENYLAVMRGGTTTILDVTDPSSPVEVAINSEVPRVLDVKWSDDGEYIFVGDDERASGDITGDLPGQAGRSGGLYVLDTSDKTSPRLVHHLNVGQFRGPHMVFYYQTPEGRELVFGANGDIGIFEFDRDTDALTELARYSPGPLGFNRDPNVVDAYYQMTAHDMFVMHDPTDMKDIMYVANWDAGLRIVDVSDPANPVELGGWNDYPEGHTGNLHTVATEWIGDRRITVGAVEVGFNVVGGVPYAQDTEPSVMYVWDTTDPANIELLGTWTNPDGRTTGLQNGYDASTHNLQIENGRVSMAHYGLGVWILDVSTPALQAEPGVLGYMHTDSMNTWDVLPHDGVTWTSGAVGVQALVFAADTPGEGPRARA